MSEHGYQKFSFCLTTNLKDHLGLPIAAGQAHGSVLQEGIIAISLRTAAVSLIAVSLLILWGLRAFTVDNSDK